MAIGVVGHSAVPNLTTPAPLFSRAPDSTARTCHRGSYREHTSPIVPKLPSPRRSAPSFLGCRIVFRTVAEHHEIEIEPDADVTEMFKVIRDVLVVLPEDVLDPVRAEAILKRLLGNLSGLCGTMAELRNAYGSGHGKADGFVGLGKMHPSLAVTTACALAAFILESDPKAGK